MIEIACAKDAPAAAVARAYDEAVSRGGIPVVSYGGRRPFISALLDARADDPEAIAATARRAVDAGQAIAAADAGVASSLAAGFPAWTGGVMLYLESGPVASTH